ncbi:ATP-dependent RNA helicase ddx54 [Geranomyces michiganensis]|nr:ATP-dependent RNA helicase ddx54 [Geranomyces michiganensis]
MGKAGGRGGGRSRAGGGGGGSGKPSRPPSNTRGKSMPKLLRKPGETGSKSGSLHGVKGGKVTKDGKGAGNDAGVDYRKDAGQKSGRGAASARGGGRGGRAMTATDRKLRDRWSNDRDTDDRGARGVSDRGGARGGLRGGRGAGRGGARGGRGRGAYGGSGSSRDEKDADAAEQKSGRGGRGAARGGRGRGRGGKTPEEPSNNIKSKGKKGKKGGDDDDEEFETVPLSDEEDAGWQSGSDIASDAGSDEGSDSGSHFDNADESGDAVSDIEMASGDDAEATSDADAAFSDEDAGDLSDDVDISSEGEGNDEEFAAKVKAANRKGRKSGGFQSMGLSYPVYKAIGHKGYKVPTPIQRRAIPIINEGRDIVAMARTGSGKTAAFIIPLLERLKTHSAKVGARALILSPSRELALQTLKFVKDLGKYTDLRFCVLVGGDSMDDQFSAIASNPDVLIATPGRLMHLIIEMNLDLKTIEYIVFDEADRLFEMGFAEQLREIMFRLPESRQTLLFSATLPKLLVDFAKAGLSDPALIRLDADTKISKDLQMYFLAVKHEDKEAALLSLFRTAIDQEELTVVFVATKHHVEYIQELLTSAGVPCTYIYGALDQTARKIHLARFRAGKVKVLIVTDVAARGIDVPLLDNVINYDFPATNKVFVHRVGRAARAGRTGKAYSLVASDEVPFLLDLQMFVDRPLVFATSFAASAQPGSDSVVVTRDPDYTTEFVYGVIPPSALAMDIEHVASTVKGNINLEMLQGITKNAYKMYSKSRPLASKDSYDRAKEISAVYLGIHPLLASSTDAAEHAQAVMIANIGKFRPAETVFETSKKGMRTAEAILMAKRRGQFGGSVAAWRVQRAEKDAKLAQQQSELIGKPRLEAADEDDLETSFTSAYNLKRKRPTSFRDENYISYTQTDAATERGYAVQTGEGPGASFAERAQAATLDLTGEDADGLKKPARGALVWDKDKRDFVRPTIGADNKKKIRTESGAVVNASFKSGRFAEWQKRSKVSLPRAGEMELGDASYRGSAAGHAVGGRKYRHNKITAPDQNSKNYQRNQKRREKEARLGIAPAGADSGVLAEPANKKQKGSGGGAVAAKSELKTIQEIAKERREKEKRRLKTGRHGPQSKGRGGGGSRGARGGGHGGGRGGRGGKR